MQGGSQRSIDFMLQQVSQCAPIDGITVSGGEPTLQAEALAVFLERVRERVTQSIIIYSGFTLAELERLSRKRPAIGVVLSLADVLIDGRYDHALNDSRGIRGSSNQTVHFLTSRHRSQQALFESEPRRLEFHDVPDGLMVVGVPSLDAWRKAALDPTGRSVLGRVD